ncbi:MAG: hypothetical protein O2819_07420 [Planctomycetota bacterium]|nr:hypothetical protein [Planctomycetota bacterium]MDA1106107.1 hypothetical protein [Planctomycetota bacterium]
MRDRLITAILATWLALLLCAGVGAVVAFRGVREAGVAAAGYPQIPVEAVVAHAGGLVARVGFTAAAWGGVGLGIAALIALGTPRHGWRGWILRLCILAGLGLGVVQFGFNASIQLASDRRWVLSLDGNQTAADAVGEAIQSVHQGAERLYAVQTIAVALAMVGAIAWGRGRRDELQAPVARAGPDASAVSGPTCPS